MLKIREISKSYQDGLKAIKNISFSVQPGEIVAIVGESGCGKTTLLRIIAGFLKPSGGKIITDARKSIGYMFQDPNFCPWRTVRENVEFPLIFKKYGLKKEEKRIFSDPLLEIVGLRGFENRMPDGLSGGELQRMILAKTLITKPKLLLLDEPFSRLDVFTGKRLQDEFLNILGELNNTITVFSTHNIEEAVYLSSRKVVVLSKRPAEVKKIVDVDLGLKGRELRKSIPFFKKVNEIEDLFGL